MQVELAAMVAPISGDFKGKDVVSIAQFERPDVDEVLQEADAMVKAVDRRGRIDLLSDLVVANLFFEPSTRTFMSFEAAAKRLGAATIAVQGVQYSSISKGETLADTIRTVASYADAISMRHPEAGSALIAAEASRVPVINGGDGVGEHPTQALLDLYTIKQNVGEIDGKKITMIGDLKHGRTVHSLAQLLALYGAELNYVSPESLAMPSELVKKLSAAGVRQYATTDLLEVIPETDVAYVTRVQGERFANPQEYEAIKDAYIVNAEVMEGAKRDMILMHPLPRVNEISTEVDSDPRAVYFDQVENGMYVRMALLALTAGRSARS